MLHHCDVGEHSRWMRLRVLEFSTALAEGLLVADGSGDHEHASTRASLKSSLSFTADSWEVASGGKAVTTRYSRAEKHAEAMRWPEFAESISWRRYEVDSCAYKKIHVKPQSKKEEKHKNSRWPKKWPSRGSKTNSAARSSSAQE